MDKIANAGAKNPQFVGDFATTRFPLAVRMGHSANYVVPPHAVIVERLLNGSFALANVGCGRLTHIVAISLVVYPPCIVFSRVRP